MFNGISICYIEFFCRREVGLITKRSILYVLFFISGCSALIYQVIWQRMLFTLFGIDLESVTVIVSVFMFGLGIGGLFGGLVSDFMRTQLLVLYIVIELGVAVFGFSSPQIIEWLGNLVSGSTALVVALMSFLILAFPTILMGATFPILVTHINLSDQHIGRSVGELYFANTLGGALGAFLSGFMLLHIMELTGAVNLAAMLNLAVASIALLVFRRRE